MDNLDVKSSSARVSNTLAGNTRENALRVLVDWVTCSFTIATDLQNLLVLLGLENDVDNVETKLGSRYEFAGYDITYKLGSIEILHATDQQDDGDGYDPTPSGRWLLNMSGQACRQYEHSTSYDFEHLFAILDNLDVKYTRLDIAIDDFTNIFNVNVIRQAVYNKQCVTRLKEWGNHTKGLVVDGSDSLTMDNFYIGSLKSRFSVNVYDKKLERISRGLESDVLDVETWTRTEVRFKNDYAQQFVDHILLDSRSIGYQIRAFLNDKLQFLTRSCAATSKNRGRDAKDKKNIARWWQKFLGQVGKLHLSVAVPDKTLQDTVNWLNKQVSVSLASVQMYKPQQYADFIQSLTAEGFKKMKKAHEIKVRTQLYLDSIKSKSKKM